MAAMTVTAEIGFHLSRRWRSRTDDLRREHFGLIMGSLLGLLALLLSFTFAMSANRYDARRQLVIGEANVLSGLYLQSSLLPDAPRQAFKQQLAQYVEFDALVAYLHRERTAEEAARANDRAEEIHHQMWKVVRDSTASDPPPKIADVMLKDLVSALSAHHDRVYALESRVPDSVIWLLLIGCLTGMGAIGLFGGLGNHRGFPARIIVTILLCATIYVVIELDRPREGLIKISQTPILHLKEILDRDPETKL